MRLMIFAVKNLFSIVFPEIAKSYVGSENTTSLTNRILFS